MSYLTGDLSVRELRRLIVDNFIETALGFGEFAGVCGEDEGTVWYHTGLAHPFLNGVVGACVNTADPLSVVKRAISRIAQNNVPFAWVVGPDDKPANLGDLLTDASMQSAFELRGMAMDLHKLTDELSVPPSLTVKEVIDEESFERLMFVQHETLSQNEVLTGFLRSYFGTLLKRGDCMWRHYLGSVDGRPVACASIYLNGGIAGIYNVGTLEAFRRRGYGAAVTVFPLIKAREQGYRWAVLHSSALGLPVYQRIGFEDICPLRVYLPGGASEVGN